MEEAVRLEDKLHGPLNDTRGYAASSGGIERRGQLAEGRGIRRQAGCCKVSVVEDIEAFKSDAKFQAFEQFGLLGNREVLIEEVRSAESVIGEVAGASGRRLPPARSRLAGGAEVRRAGAALDGEKSESGVDIVDARSGAINADVIRQLLGS